MVDIDITYEPESGVPIPVNRAPNIPLSELEIGDSILFPKSRRASVQSHASRLAKEEDKRFTVRSIDDDHCRVWRIS